MITNQRIFLPFFCKSVTRVVRHVRRACLVYDKLECRIGIVKMHCIPALVYEYCVPGHRPFWIPMYHLEDMDDIRAHALWHLERKTR